MFSGSKGHKHFFPNYTKISVVFSHKLQNIKVHGVEFTF